MEDDFVGGGEGSAAVEADGDGVGHAAEAHIGDEAEGVVFRTQLSGSEADGVAADGLQSVFTDHVVERAGGIRSVEFVDEGGGENFLVAADEEFAAVVGALAEDVIVSGAGGNAHLAVVDVVAGGVGEREQVGGVDVVVELESVGTLGLVDDVLEKIVEVAAGDGAVGEVGQREKAQQRLAVEIDAVGGDDVVGGGSAVVEGVANNGAGVVDVEGL